MLSEFIGQKDRLSALTAAINAAKNNNRSLPNMLLLGRPGNGKTTLAQLIADEMDQPIVLLHAASAVDRASIAEKILEAENGILFIDEVHALDRRVCEDLYTVLDNGQISLVTDEPLFGPVVTYFLAPDELIGTDLKWNGPGSYIVEKEIGVFPTMTSVQLEGITIIGATTDEALLPPAFLSRLSALKVYLRDYDEVELGTIATLYADQLGLELPKKSAAILAIRSRFNPRRVKQLVERASDQATDGKITVEVVNRALGALGVDETGLEPPHRAMLGVLAEGPLSRTSLGQRLGIPPKNVDHYFGDLMQQGLVRIDRKHEITEKGMTVIG